ncbi:MAG: ATP-binding protein [Bacteroidota bacterium]
MNAINGFTELLLNTNLSEEEKKEYLKVIDLSGKNLVSIIDDLIEMSKIDSNLIEPNYTSLNLESCINELYETIKVTIPKTKKIEFSILPAQNPVEYNIITDGIKLKQIIINLITNAIKFTDKGTVTFGYTIDTAKEQIVFTITDTGLGIDDYDQKHIFDRFKRIDSDLSIKEGGLGLGLSISKAYVEMLNGTITLKSDLGKGSEFSFTIPLEYNKIEAIIVHQVINEITVVDKTEGLILIAEDDNINYILFEKIMKQKNFQIIRAINGKEAVEICLNNPNIDLVLMDIKMPIMNGFEALELIRPIRPNLPIIAQTAYSSAEDKEKIFGAGFTNYITKPLNREQLFDLINLYLNEKQT